MLPIPFPQGELSGITSAGAHRRSTSTPAPSGAAKGGEPSERAQPPSSTCRAPDRDGRRVHHPRRGGRRADAGRRAGAGTRALHLNRPDDPHVDGRRPGLPAPHRSRRGHPRRRDRRGHRQQQPALHAGRPHLRDGRLAGLCDRGRGRAQHAAAPLGDRSHDGIERARHNGHDGLLRNAGRRKGEGGRRGRRLRCRWGDRLHRGADREDQGCLEGRRDRRRTGEVRVDRRRARLRRSDRLQVAGCGRAPARGGAGDRPVLRQRRRRDPECGAREHRAERARGPLRRDLGLQHAGRPDRALELLDADRPPRQDGGLHHPGLLRQVPGRADGGGRLARRGQDQSGRAHSAGARERSGCPEPAVHGRKHRQGDRSGLRQQRGEEVDERAGGLLGPLIPDEVARAVEQHELRAGYVRVEALGHRHAGERVALAPQHERGHSQRAHAPLVRGELLEVPGPVELELGEPSRVVPEGLPVLVQGILAEPRAQRLQRAAEPLAREGHHELLAGLRRAHRVREVVPAAVRPEPAVRDHERADGVRVVARPPQADHHSPVMRDEHDRPERELLDEPLDGLHVVLPCAGRVRVGISEPRQVGRDRVPARSRQCL